PRPRRRRTVVLASGPGAAATAVPSRPHTQSGDGPGQPLLRLPAVHPDRAGRAGPDGRARPRRLGCLGRADAGAGASAVPVRAAPARAGLLRPHGAVGAVLGCGPPLLHPLAAAVCRAAADDRTGVPGGLPAQPPADRGRWGGSLVAGAGGGARARRTALVHPG